MFRLPSKSIGDFVILIWSLLAIFETGLTDEVIRDPYSGMNPGGCKHSDTLNN